MNKLFISLLIGLFLISFASAFGYDNIAITKNINYSLINTNNSIYWQGWTPLTIPGHEYWYNMTSAGSSSAFNQTYDDTANAWNGNSSMVYNHTQSVWDLWGNYFYNMTQPFTDWLTGFKYNYNQTAPAVTYCNAMVSSNNASWLSTYNATYEGYSFGAINETLASINTFGTWGRNATTLAWANITNVPANATIIHYTNITGTQQAGCTNTDKLKNVTMTNGVLSSTCEADATAGVNAYQLTADQVTTNITVFNTTLFTMPVLANTDYTINCVIFSNTSATTVGVWLNVTVPASPKQFIGTWNSPTTTTAPLWMSCYTLGKGTMPSCATVQTTAIIDGYHYFDGTLQNGINAGNVLLTMRSEAAGTVRARQGSYCRIST